MKNPLLKLGCCILLGIPIIPGNGYSQPTNQGPPGNAVQSRSAETLSETELLRTELRVIQEHNDRLLATVYWSLGTIAGLAVLLVGFSWFTNYKIYERDKSALHQEFTALIKAEIGETQKALEVSFAKMFDDFKDRTVESIKAETKASVTRLEDSVSSLQNGILRLKYKSIENEARYWELQGVKANELDRYLEMLPLAMELMNDHEINMCLERILRMMKKGSYPFHGYVPDLISKLDSLPNKFTTNIEAIKARLKDAQAD